MDAELQDIVKSTYTGYIVLDGDGVVSKTQCPNSAAASALRLCGQGKSGIRVYSVGTMGKYHHTPGERVCWEYDWQRAVRELFG